MEELIERALPDLRSISFHSDGRIIAKTGGRAKHPGKLYSAMTIEEVLGKLIVDKEL